MQNDPKLPLSATQRAPSEIADTIDLKVPHIAGANPEQQKVFGTGVVSQKISVDPKGEYVSGGGYVWLARYIRALPFYIDDVSRDFGDDLYERMRLDPQIAAALNIRKLAVLAQGVQFNPVEDDEELVNGHKASKASDNSKEIAKFCQANMDRLVRPLKSVLYEMMDAIGEGHKIAEQIYEVPATGPLADKLCLKALKVKPRRSASIVVDVYMNTIGVIGLIPGQGAPVIFETILSTPQNIPNLLPRQKFMILSHRMKDNDPRGTSDFRPCYNPWWLKQQTWGQYLTWQTQWATPSLIGYTAPGAIAVQDASGNNISPEAQMLTGLLQFRAGSASAFPAGSKVDVVEVHGEGAPFLEAIDLYDRQICKAITGQTLATEEGVHQARAASETHQDILGLVISGDKEELADVLKRDVLEPLVRYNFGEEAVCLTPNVSFGKTEDQDFSEAAKAIAALTTSGYLHYSQYVGTDQMLSLPPRDAEAQSEEIKKEQSALDPTLLAQDIQQQVPKKIARSEAEKQAGRLGGQDEQ